MRENILACMRAILCSERQRSMFSAQFSLASWNHEGLAAGIAWLSTTWLPLSPITVTSSQTRLQKRSICSVDQVYKSRYDSSEVLYRAFTLSRNAKQRVALGSGGAYKGISSDIVQWVAGVEGTVVDIAVGVSDPAVENRSCDTDNTTTGVLGSCCYRQHHERAMATSQCTLKGLMPGQSNPIRASVHWEGASSWPIIYPASCQDAH